MKMRSFFIIFTLLFIPGFTQALEFSQVKLYSYLNEPLIAEIEVLGAEEFGADQIQVSLASDQEFKRLGMPKATVLNNLVFELKRSSNRTYIKITSTTPLSEPYIEYLLNLKSPQGQVLHGYTFLFDPIPAHAMPYPVRLAKVENLMAEDVSLRADVSLPASADVSLRAHAKQSSNSEKLFEESPANTQNGPQFETENPPMTIISSLAASEMEQEFSKPVSSVHPLQNPEPNPLISVTEKKPLEQIAQSSQQKQKKPNITTKKTKRAFNKTQLVFISLTVCLLAVVLYGFHLRRHSKQFLKIISQNKPKNLKPDFPEESNPNFSIPVSNEISMKLDLARHYIALGSLDHAIPLLEEILLYGTGEEKETAETLLSEIPASSPAS